MWVEWRGSGRVLVTAGSPPALPLGAGSRNRFFRRLVLEERFKSWQHFVSDQVVYLPQPVDSNELVMGAKQETDSDNEGHFLGSGLRMLDSDHNPVAIIKSTEVLSCPADRRDDARKGGLDAPMLVRINELGEGKQEPEFRAVRAVVRLKCFHLAPDLIGEVRERLVGKAVERTRLVSQNESRGAAWLRLSEPVDREGVDDMVEAGPEVGDGVTGWPRPCPGWPRADDMSERARRERGIELRGHLVRLRALIEEGLDPGIEIVDMKQRPFQLEAGA